MIVVTHTHGVVNKVSPDQTSSLEGKLLVEALFVLSKSNPQSLLVWCEKAYEGYVNTDKIKALFKHDLLMMSYSVGSNYAIAEDIGYVEDSPFLKINRDACYPTWLMSSNVGMIHGSVLELFQQFGIKGNADYILSSIAKIGQRNGLLCYSSPELLNTAGLSIEEKSNSKVTTHDLFKFVYQHYKTRWMFLLLLNYFLFDKKFPLFSFLKGFFSKKLISAKPNVDEISVKANTEFLEKSMDVIIPTIGRKQYLYDVLKDLANQTILPKKVIIVEQNPELNSQTELDYLIQEEWPFVISHEFTHQTGACNARNIAIQKIESDWVFMADDDIRFSENTVERVFDFLEKYNARVVTLSCLRKGDVEKESQVLQWRSFGSGCSVVSSKVVKSTFFDMGFEHGFGEDTDYGMQLRNKGYDVLYNPFIQLQHLKAAVGGFRKPIPKPWEVSHILPKPSPTIMLFRLKHTSKTQLKGYKLLLFLRFYKEQSDKNPFTYIKKMKLRWNSSIDWAKKLMEI